MSSIISLSAGVVVVRRFGGEPHFLLLRAYDYWDFPKGLVESGEQPFQAAVREVEEETTLADLQFVWGREFRETPPYGKGKIARYYLAESPYGEVDLPVSPELGFPEHEEFRWLVYGSAAELLKDRLQPILKWAYQTVVPD
jgi:bis(5'-nucleosidyl)-tetraphosphatase